MENKLNSYFYVFPWAKTNEIMLKIDEWIRPGPEEYGQQFTPKAYPHRVIFMGMMNEIPISSQGPKGGNTQCLQDAERNAAHIGKLKPGYFMYIGPSSEETWKFEKVHRQPKRKMGRACRTIHECISCTKTSSPERMQKLPKIRFEARWQNHALQRRSRISKDDKGTHQLSRGHLYDFGFNCSWSKGRGNCQSVSGICC